EPARHPLLSRDGRWVAVLQESNDRDRRRQLTLWDRQDPKGARRTALDVPQKGALPQMAFSANGKVLACLLLHEEQPDRPTTDLVIWPDLPSRKFVPFRLEVPFPSPLALNATGSLCALGNGGNITIHQTSDGKVLRRLEAH